MLSIIGMDADIKGLRGFEQEQFWCLTGKMLPAV